MAIALGKPIAKDIFNLEPLGSIMAAPIEITIPLVILVTIFQYRIVANLTAA
jgi:hypothetical protein